MKNSLLFFIFSILFSSCSEFEKNARDNLDKLIYVDTQNITGDYKTCYVNSLLKTWEKVEIIRIINGTPESLKDFQTLSFDKINKIVDKPQKQTEKVVIVVQGDAGKEGTLYFIESFVLKEDTWMSKGNRKEFKVMKIHPDDKSPYGLDVDEVCEQMISNTIRTVLQ